MEGGRKEREREKRERLIKMMLKKSLAGKFESTTQPRRENFEWYP